MPLSAQSLDFLFANKLENNKDWYEEHKSDYRKYVVEPLAEMVSTMAPFMLQIDDRFICEPKIGKCISRVRRDTRYTRDKSLYRDTAWISFRRDKKEFHNYPCFFFEASPRGYLYGCGFYEADRSTMESMREKILSDDPLFIKADKAYRKSNFNMTGDMYKRTRFPDASDSQRLWLDRKSLCFISGGNNFDLLFSDKITDLVTKEFLGIKDIYSFLISLDY